MRSTEMRRQSYSIAHGGELGPAVKLCDQIDLQSGYVDVAGGTASVFAECPSEGGPQYLLDAETLEMRAIVADQSGRRSALSSDGRFVASQSGRVVTHNGEEMYLVGQIVLRDATSGEMVRTMDGLCEWVESEGGDPRRMGPDCVAISRYPFPRLALGPRLLGRRLDAGHEWSATRRRGRVGHIDR